MTTFLDNNDDSTLSEENDKGKCTTCGKIDCHVKKVEIYYKGGRKLKLAYLCYNIRNDYNTINNIENSCYFNYYKDLGLGSYGSRMGRKDL